MVRRFERAVITGYHELPVVKRSDRDTLALIGEAVAGALEDAGLDGSDVDGLAIAGFTLPPDHGAHLVRRLGLQVRWLFTPDPGGVGGVSAVAAAARAIDAGDADVIVCTGGDVLDRATLGRLMEEFSTDVRDWLAPIGAEPANVTFALLQDRYMREHGVSRADIGAVSVLQRQHGAANTQALLRDPIDLAQYLAAPAVATPIHLLDCVYPGSGAAAVVLRRAQGTGSRQVRVVAGAERHGYARGWPPESLGWSDFADDLFASGIARDEVDVLELYDDYPLMVLWQLEELGFCPRGRGAAFVSSRGLGVASPPALNTGGGMLACGQAGAAGGYVPLVEAVRQLLAEGGDRQVPAARRALVSGLGMVAYGVPLSTGALLLEAPS